MEILIKSVGITALLLSILYWVTNDKNHKSLIFYTLMFLTNSIFIFNGKFYFAFISLLTFFIIESSTKTNVEKKSLLSKYSNFQLKLLGGTAVINVLVISFITYLKKESISTVMIENELIIPQSDKVISGIVIIMVLMFVSITKVRPWKS